MGGSGKRAAALLLPYGLNAGAKMALHDLVHHVHQQGGYSVPAPLNAPKCARRHLRRHETLHRTGEQLSALFIVRLGILKSLTLSEDGLVQVTDFLMATDVIGLDGICTGRHQSEVVALDDSEVFVLPYAQCEQWSRASAHGQRLMARTLASKIERGHEHMIMLGTMHMEQRVATFLLDLSERFGRFGYSRSQFMFRMTREEIGSYLGLKLETVSRALSHLQRQGFVQLQGKSIALLDFPALRRISGTSRDRQRPAVPSLLNQEGELAVA
jgi:CRP/FNR family transcriptional regulator, anaerobic regulatory protein